MVWFVQFHETFDCESIIGGNITINNSCFGIKNANERPNQIDTEVTLKAMLRVHWLPLNFSPKKVESFLKDSFVNSKIEIKSIDREKYLDEMKDIENGNLRIKIEYPIEENQRVIDLIGVQKVDSIKALIQLCGWPPRCRFCKKFSHPAQQCPRKNKICSKYIELKKEKDLFKK